MFPPPDAAIARHLTHIQEACREYVVQADRERKMTFATIRIAADAIATLADDAGQGTDTDEVRTQVHRIHAALDELSARYGTDTPGACRACGSPLRTVSLGSDDDLQYCTVCAEEILSAVRTISDITGADIL